MCLCSLCCVLQASLCRPLASAAAVTAARSVPRVAAAALVLTTGPPRCQPHPAMVVLAALQSHAQSHFPAQEDAPAPYLGRWTRRGPPPCLGQCLSALAPCLPTLVVVVSPPCPTLHLVLAALGALASRLAGL
jgi:hypothetical protein